MRWQQMYFDTIKLRLLGIEIAACLKSLTVRLDTNL